MARFAGQSSGTNSTVNHEGAPAYKLPPEVELYSLVCTSTLSNKFYESADEQMQRMQGLMKQVDPKFVGQLAVYAREDMHLRTVPLVLAASLAGIHKGDSLVRRVTHRVIQRADEIKEALACYAVMNGHKVTEMSALRKMSKQFQKGVASAFHKFNEYKFSKYNRDSKPSFKEAMFVVHPKPMNETEDELFKKIINGTLETADTWEAKLSKKDGVSKQEKWEEMILSGKMGYMAMLRNLRNFLEQKVSKDALEIVAQRLADPEEVRNSKQFPFRYLSAFRMIHGQKSFEAEAILGALEEAVKISIENIPLLVEGDCVIACDVSGSMQQTFSEKSTVQMYDIGLLLGQLLKLKTPRTITGIFGEHWKAINFRSETPLQNTMYLHSREGEVGYSTNGYLVIQDLIKRNAGVDKVFFFSDSQMWSSFQGGQSGFGYNRCQGELDQFNTVWAKYKKNVPHTKAYFFDLSGYGNTPISILDSDVYFISGWSEKIFTVLKAMEDGEDAVAQIKKIVI